ncbi:hypothetical protein [Arthrobacter sp.]|uniref:hypothetical protein n=1 Tax=Arthrobacter sp. TaxID=1667 RepID=UPI0026E0F208|nr:hypothetical protein [Arthrobacter sp.]MDO5752968.1 hypothetical protein [Arthrobacter sp.]
MPTVRPPMNLVGWPGSIQVVALVNPLGILGPAAAELILVRVTDGQPDVRHFWANVTSLRIGLLWWVIARLGIPALLLIDVLFLPGTLDSFTSESLAGALMLYQVQLLGIVFLGGGLAAILAHASINGPLGILIVAFPGSLVETTNWWGLGIILAAEAVALVTRGQLGMAVETTPAIADLRPN